MLAVIPSPFQPLSKVFAAGAWVRYPIRAINGDFSAGKFELTNRPKLKFMIANVLIWLSNLFYMIYWNFVGFDFFLAMDKLKSFGIIFNNL